MLRPRLGLREYERSRYDRRAPRLGLRLREGLLVYGRPLVWPLRVSLAFGDRETDRERERDLGEADR